MAARVKIVLDPTGIRVNPNLDVEVTMQIIPSVAIVATPGRNIWTANMTDCAAVATYDHTNNSRTLCHGGGGNFAGHAGYIHDLATKISADTTIIFALGVDWNQNSPSERTAINSTKLAIEAEMTALNKATNLLNWVEFWAPPWAVGQKQERGTFVLHSDGTYGEKLR